MKNFNVKQAVFFMLLLASFVALGFLSLIACEDNTGSPVETEPTVPTVNLNSIATVLKIETMDSIDFGWTISGLSNVEFDVYLDTNSSPVTKISSDAVALTNNKFSYVALTDNKFSYAVAKLSPSTTYYWQVIATSTETQEETKSRVGSFETTSGIALSLPYDANSTQVVGEAIVFEWLALSKLNGGSFDIYMDENNPPTTQIKTALDYVPSNESRTQTFSYTPPSNLTAGTPYYWKIVGTGTNEGTEARYESAIFSFTLRDVIEAFSPSDGATGVLRDNLTLDWTVSEAVLDSTTTYDVYFGTETDPTQSIAQNISDTMYTHSAPSALSNNNTRYYWKVEAKQAGRQVYTSRIYSFILVPNTAIEQDGYVTVSRGGGPVRESIISVFNVAGDNVYTTRTDATGHFSVPVYEGTWKVSARKEGRATSEATFTIGSTAIYSIPLLQFPIETNFYSLTPPVISVEGVRANQTFTTEAELKSTFDINASATAVEGNSMTHGRARASFSLAINGHGYGYYETQSRVVGDIATINYNVWIAALPSGTVYFEFVAYDNNNNQSMTIIPIIMNEATLYVDTEGAGKPPPGSIADTNVYIAARTLGHNKKTYSVSDDSNVSIEIYVNVSTKYEQHGIMIYRSTNRNDDESYRYIGSSRVGGEFTIQEAQALYFYYDDRSPELEDGSIYYYKIKYYASSRNTGNKIFSEDSDVITVPILPRVELTLIEPADNTVYETQPSMIDFIWNVAYSKDIATDIMSKVTRNDALEMYEVATTHDDVYSSITSIVSADINTSTSITKNVDASEISGGIGGRTYFWTVNSDLSYEDTSANGFVVLESISYPTISGEKELEGSAQNGAFVFAVE